MSLFIFLYNGGFLICIFTNFTNIGISLRKVHVENRTIFSHRFFGNVNSIGYQSKYLMKHFHNAVCNIQLQSVRKHVAFQIRCASFHYPATNLSYTSGGYTNKLIVEFHAGLLTPLELEGGHKRMIQGLRALCKMPP